MKQQDRRGTERAVSTKPIDVAPGDTATISRRAMLALSGAGGAALAIGHPGIAAAAPAAAAAQAEPRDAADA